jgi:hypothetical protein
VIRTALSAHHSRPSCYVATGLISQTQPGRGDGDRRELVSLRRGRTSASAESGTFLSNERCVRTWLLVGSVILQNATRAADLKYKPRSALRSDAETLETPSRPAGVRLRWSVRPECDDWTRYSEGCYVLRTNITDWDAEQLWRTYIQLSEAEAAFRIHKSELAIRPSGISARIAFKLTSWCAFSLTSRRRPWSNGKAARDWATARGPFLMNSAGSSTDVVVPLAEDPTRILRLLRGQARQGAGPADRPTRAQTARSLRPPSIIDPPNAEM